MAAVGLSILAAFGFVSSAILSRQGMADIVVISPIVSSSPLVTLFLAHVFLTRLERVTRRLAAGTALAVTGVLLVVWVGQL